ncbi:cell growth-regulating nucleolar protein isoform X2 [Puntigrus tetrazona]|uniref:cell growth-regulating nucleolar protein isoform X2 n=1 Tax=Puntigrus tetrazona TaxID=1606681 RepID=UPI001C8989B9|nr:cell growth-regulating nucleolar protein isoform X2 [Puntigrus tetrazona]
MVFFTCNACGESLKKAQVEKHVLKCRACQVLSCIDCSKDFWGDDYKNHNKCISEDQKYGGKDVQVKANKGDVKQQQWIQRIQQAMEQPGLKPNVWKILQMVSTHNNVPRKKAKFENWMRNCLKIYDPLLLDKVWEICSTAANNNSNQINHQAASECESRSDPNDCAETNKNSDEKKKRKTDDTLDEQNGENTDESKCRGDDYKNHNKCISEDQKYGGKDVQVKANKGDEKQQQWNQRIQQALEQPDVETSVRKIVQKVSTHDNVPRKKAKFENDNHQTTNNCTETNENSERKNKKSKRNASEEQNGEKTEEKQRRKKRKRGEEKEQITEEKSSKKQKKRKREALEETVNLEREEPENHESESNSAGKFHWKGTIKAVLRDASEDGLAVKKLRKKVLAAYHSFSGDSNFRSEEELLSLFNRKINKNPKFKILKDKVRLVK